MFCVFCQRFRKSIPVTFLTGFYVSQVVSRYWNKFSVLPYPDKIAMKIVTHICGTVSDNFIFKRKNITHCLNIFQDDYSKNLRRTVMRYINLSNILVFRIISPKASQRFPDLQSLINEKLLTNSEAGKLEVLQKSTPQEFTWAPMVWAMQLLKKARSEKKIEVSLTFKCYQLTYLTDNSQG